MPYADLIANLLNSSGLTQYPDAKVYKAASMLKPEERPTAPVSVAERDPKKYPILRVSPNTAAISHADPANTLPPSVTVFKGTPAYDSQDPRMLAAQLAHEAIHVNRKDYAEVPAYEQEQKTLARLGFLRDNPEYVRNLSYRIAQLKKQER